MTKNTEEYRSEKNGKKEKEKEEQKESNQSTLNLNFTGVLMI